MGRNKDINIQRIAEVDQAVTTRIRITPYREASQQAAQCHASQTTGHRTRLIGYLTRWLPRYDTFSRAFPPFEKGALESDLFAGIGEELGPGD
jgi:hypothetical protein